MKKIINIEGMSCSHCVRNVKNTLEELDGVTGATVDLEKKQAVLTLAKDVEDNIIKEAIDEIGYEVIEISEM